MACGEVSLSRDLEEPASAGLRISTCACKYLKDSLLILKPNYHINFKIN
jgi:hypothetical protein